MSEWIEQLTNKKYGVWEYAIRERWTWTSMK